MKIYATNIEVHQALKMNFLQFIILFALHLVSSQFTYAPPLVICNYQKATLGAPVSNYCKGVSSGTTLNLYSRGALSSKNGYLSFLPTAIDASAELRFGGGSCYDARGISEFVLQMQVSTPISFKITFGTSEGCLNRDSADTSTTISVAGSTTYQTIRLPVSFFADMNLQRLYTIGIQSVSPLNVEIKILKIYFSRKQFVTRTRHELFEWTSTGVRVPYRFSSFNAPNMIGRTGKGPDGLLDPYEQEDLFISAKQLGGRVIRTYTLRVRTPSDISAGNGTSKAIQGIGSWGEAQLLALDRTLMFANKHMIRVILPFIDNWEFFGGVQSFAAFRGKTRDSFFTDSTLISDFKNVFFYLTLGHQYAS
jgi:hypothetical protein